MEQGQLGLRLGGRGGGGGAIEPPGWTPPEKAQLAGPPNPNETHPQALVETPTQKSAKNENGIFGISASRGFRKIIICHVFGDKNVDLFYAQKNSIAFGKAPRRGERDDHF